MEGKQKEYAEIFERINNSLEKLGLNGATGTQMGAIEILACEIKDGFEKTNDYLSEIACSLRDLNTTLEDIALVMPDRRR